MSVCAGDFYVEDVLEYDNSEMMRQMNAGNGRYDIQLKPTTKKLPGIIIELEAEKTVRRKSGKKVAVVSESSEL